jgi:hypothetical protein
VFLSAELVKHGSEGQGENQATRVRQIPGRGKRLISLVQDSVWIAKILEGIGRKAQANHPRVLSSLVHSPKTHNVSSAVLPIAFLRLGLLVYKRRLLPDTFYPV